MTFSKTLSAALVASATLVSAAPALALVPGSEHYRERAEQVERQAVASGLSAEASRSTERQSLGADRATFGYAVGTPGTGSARINNDFYRDRADELSRHQIQTR